MTTMMFFLSGSDLAAQMHDADLVDLAKRMLPAAVIPIMK